MIKAKYLVPLSNDISKPSLNFDEMLVGAEEFASKYKGQVVTKETLTVAKVSAAEMNEVRNQLSEMRKELRKRALDIVAPAIDQIDRILEVIEEPYLELKAGIDDVKRQMDDEKQKKMFEEVEKVCKEHFASVLAANSHLSQFVKDKCSLRKGSWLTQGVRMSEIAEALQAEAKRMQDEMDFIERHVKDKSPEVIRFAKVFLVEHGFDGKQTLDATDKYEVSLAEQAKREEERKQKAMDEAKARLERMRNSETPSVEKSAPKVRYFRFKLAVTGTKESLTELRKFIDASGITFEKLSDMEEVDEPTPSCR
jgi:hypothetical protein